MATVSAAIPVYNSAAFIAEAVESVFAQTRLPDELVVVDDGSTDTTPEILRELAGRYPLRVIRQENGGEASARNRLVQEAKGDLIAFLDHDDLWHPQKLAVQMEHIGDADLSFTDVIEQHDDFSESYTVPDWQPEEALASLSRECFIRTASVALVRRDVLETFEPVEPYGTDWLMWLRLAETGRRIIHLPETLTTRRLHGSNMTDSFPGWLAVSGAVLRQLGNPRYLAWWHLNAAIAAKTAGDRAGARRHVVTAARTHPASVRPGWVRLFA